MLKIFHVVMPSIIKMCNTHKREAVRVEIVLPLDHRSANVQMKFCGGYSSEGFLGFGGKAKTSEIFLSLLRSKSGINTECLTRKRTPPKIDPNERDSFFFFRNNDLQTSDQPTAYSF